MSTKKIATANWMAESYFGITKNKDYVLEQCSLGMWLVYDFNGNYITASRTDCFDNYRDIN